jgi:hypothetical protein
MGMEFPETASWRLITPTAHQIAVGRDASPPQTAGFFVPPLSRVGVCGG